MVITKEFCSAEIAELESEMANARAFLLKAQAAVDVHRMLLAKLDAPEVVAEPEAVPVPDAEIPQGDLHGRDLS